LSRFEAGNMRSRILVIRGGALGDFVLTLPALRLLRENFPETEIEILGYPHIASLAEGRHYAGRVRSIEYAAMAGFFARNGTLDTGLCEYFAGFGQVISYLYDPDGIFEANLRVSGVKHYLAAYGKPVDRHAALEWAAPLEKLALFLDDPAARLHPTQADLAEAKQWLAGGRKDGKRLALHPGSGSSSKNWRVEGWASVGERFWEENPQGEIVLVGGEADGVALGFLERAWAGKRVRLAKDLRLPLLAAVLAECGCYAGHDSGVSHVAAAVGARCVLLFGPTDPAVWAPANLGVTVVRAPLGQWAALEERMVWERVRGLWEA
jgi:heptosyltransferase-2